MAKHEKIVEFRPIDNGRKRRQAVTAHVRAQPEVCGKILAFQQREDNSLEELVQSYGIPIAYVDLPLNLAGFLYPAKRHTDSGWEIVVNKKLSEKERRWTIAHEFSHWILDKKCQKPDFDDEKVLPLIRGGGSIAERYSVETVEVFLDRERQVKFAKATHDPFFFDFDAVLESELRANLLAGYILLPTPTLRSALDNGRSCQQIAEKHLIPVNVVRRQIKDNPRLKRYSVPQD